jgi:peptidoglycan/xylan/chitin deacetylase (PgdA/CDA1 family)
MAAGGMSSGQACNRPAGMAAVTLTYDDSLGSHVSTVGPALAAHNLKATFFVVDVRANQAPWAGLRAAGHELGSHTLKHPCPKANSFVPPGDANEDYDVARMSQELDDSIAMLKALGQTAPFTFAYPCGVDWIGEDQQSYVSLVKDRFSAARGVSPGLVQAGVDLGHVPATFTTGDAAELIALAESAKNGGGWVVFGFHGVGGDHTPVSAEAHEALLAHLDEKRSEIYVGTFGELAACLGP